MSLYQNPWKSGSRVFSFVVTEGETEGVVLLDALPDANALEVRQDCVEVAPQLKQYGGHLGNFEIYGELPIVLWS